MPTRDPTADAPDDRPYTPVDVDPDDVDEATVRRLLRANDGELRQKWIVDALPRSKAWVSDVLGTLAEEGAVAKRRAGRENRVELTTRRYAVQRRAEALVAGAADRTRAVADRLPGPSTAVRRLAPDASTDDAGIEDEIRAAMESTDDEPLTQAELAAELDAPKSTVSVHLSAMREEGEVATPDDPRDARRNLVVPTDADGETVVETDDVSADDGAPSVEAEIRDATASTDDEPLTQADLVERLPVSKSTVSRHLSTLREDGEVRTPPDPADPSRNLVLPADGDPDDRIVADLGPDVSTDDAAARSRGGVE